MNRRKFLKITGTASVIFAAGASGYVLTRTPHKALAPWDMDEMGYPDPMRRALSYAILAPNPHNRQPWTVSLLSDSEAILSCDLDRLLPETDPFDRQIVIGLGCFLELFSMATVHDGYRAEIKLFPEGQDSQRLDTRPIARLSLVKDETVSRNGLFDYALSRHTNRNPYDLNRPIDSTVFKKIQNAALDGVDVGTSGSENTDEQRQQLRDLTRDALRDEILDPVAFQESVDLMRIGKCEIEQNPDGITLGGAFLETLNLLGILTRKEFADPSSESFKIGLDMADESAVTAMGFVWINTDANTRVDQIAAGRCYMRIALEVTRQGLVMQPMSQALQEYPAMEPYYNKVHQMLATNVGERVQMLARLGYADKVLPAPRWALSTRIK